MANAENERPTYAADFIKGDWNKAVYLDNVHVDNLMSAFITLGTEHWTLRRRMMVLEQLLAKSKSIDLAEVESFDPDPELQAAWQAERDDYIERTFAVLTRDAYALPDDMPS